MQILHNNEVKDPYAYIETVTPWPGEKAAPENPIRYFSFEDGRELPEGTPEWICEIIEKAAEWRDGDIQPEFSGNGDEPPPMDDDDIPF